MRRVAMLVVSALLVLTSCNEQGGDGKVNEKNADGVQSKEERQVEIAEMEQAIKGFDRDQDDSRLKSQAENLLKRYRDYISINPRDSMSAEYLFKAADLSIGVGKAKASIRYLDRLIQDFPNFRKAPEMMLFIGFVYEVHLQQHAEAVKAYEAMIERYPNHRLSDDARASIQNLTMSEEELLKKFKEMNAEKEG